MAPPGIRRRPDRCREELAGVPTLLRYVARAGQAKGSLYGADALSACQVGYSTQLLAWCRREGGRAGKA